MKQVNVGLLGFGLSGRVFHAPIFTCVDGFNLSKIYTRSDDKKDLAASLYPDATVVDNVESIIDDPNIDLIVISLPNTAHYEMAERSLIAGKHVVVEKPFTTKYEDATALINIAKEEDKLLSVYHNRRFDGDFLTLQKIIGSKKLGTIREFESHYDKFVNTTDSGRWREAILPGSGMLFDLGSHLIDQAVQLFGMPKEVYADICIQRPNGLVDDHFEIIFYYTDLKVTLKTSMLVKEDLPRFILQGDAGSYVKYGFDPQEDELRQGIRPDEWEDWGTEEAKSFGTLNYIENGLNIRGTVETLPGDYRLYYKNIYKAITEGAPLTVTTEQARNIIKLIEIAKESNKEKRRVSLEE